VDVPSWPIHASNFNNHLSTKLKLKMKTNKARKLLAATACCVLLAWVAPLLTGCGHDDDDIPEELAAIAGRWQLVEQNSVAASEHTWMVLSRDYTYSFYTIGQGYVVRGLHFELEGQKRLMVYDENAIDSGIVGVWKPYNLYCAIYYTVNGDTMSTYESYHASVAHRKYVKKK